MYNPGLYEATANVFIRREPRIVEGETNNRVGKLTVGTQREVYGFVTNPDNSTWGRISEADSAGIAQWVCIKGLNRTYMKAVEGSEPQDKPGAFEIRLTSLEARINRIEVWARSQGYK